MIDDEANVRDLLRRVLEEAGYAVETAADGQEGLEKILNNRPDLVVLDLMMPVLDGWAVLKRLERREPPPVVLMLSAYTNRRDAIQAGAAECLSKPFKVADIVEVCERALSWRSE